MENITENNTGSVNGTHFFFLRLQFKHTIEPTKKVNNVLTIWAMLRLAKAYAFE